MANDDMHPLVRLGMDRLLAQSSPRQNRGHILDLSEMPSPDARAGLLSELSEYAPTWGDFASNAEGMARSVASAPGEAWADAYDDPSLSSVGKAGATTALAFNQPGKAFAMAAPGLVGALADEFDVFGGEASASSKKKGAAAPPTAPQIPGLSAEEQAVYEDAYRTLNSSESMPGRRRQAAKETVDGFMERMGAKAAEQERLRLAEYAQKTQEANTVKNEIKAKDVRFADTPFGQWHQENASWLPFALAAGGGAASRMMTGPAKDASEKALKDWIMPIFTGSTAAFGPGYNAAEMYDSSVPGALNPEREAYLKYDYLLPDGHPDKGKAKEYALEQEEINPVKTAAADSFSENWKKRAAMSLFEGVSLGKIGAGAVNLPRRVINDGFENFKNRNASAATTSGGQGGTGGGNNPIGPNGPPPNPPPPNLATGPYKKLPSDVRGRVQDAYVGGRAQAGGTDMIPSLGAPKIKQYLERLGYDVPVTTPRVKETNAAVRQFIQQEGREPISKADWARIFTDKTLAVPLAAGGAALGMGGDEPDEYEILRQYGFIE
jgi:hypothetical protein